MESQQPEKMGKLTAAVLTDTELMNEFAASGGRDDKSLSKLVVRHQSLVLNVIRRAGVRQSDAEEVAADVWVRVMHVARRGTWNPARGVHTTDPFVPLLKKIARNIAIDFHRKASRHNRNMGRLKEAADRHGDDWRA